MTQASKIDKWSAPLGLTKVGEELLKTLNHTEDNYYYAISSVTDKLSDYNFLKNNIKQTEDKLTFVNLWINSNYQKTRAVAKRLLPSLLPVTELTDTSVTATNVAYSNRPVSSPRWTITFNNILGIS
jgi:hypothetical protein